MVANHCSYLDFIVAAATLPSDVHILVKGELRDTPLVGAVLRRLGHLFVDRHSTARSLADLEQVVELLRAGRRVLVFPEGTFSAEIGLRPFKLGAFRLACEHDVPVVPCAMRGTRKALRDGTWLPKHSALAVEVLPALRPAGREVADVVALRDAAAAAIAEHVDEPRLFAADIAVPGAG